MLTSILYTLFAFATLDFQFWNWSEPTRVAFALVCFFTILFDLLFITVHVKSTIETTRKNREYEKFIDQNERRKKSEQMKWEKQNYDKPN